MPRDYYYGCLSMLLLPFVLLSPIPVSSLASKSSGKVTIRVCIDKDCRIDGCDATFKIAKALAPNSVAVETCGCLGPCGGGPNLDVRLADGTRAKDTRPEALGSRTKYCFKNVRTVDDVKSVLQITGVDVGNKRCDLEAAESSRGFLDFDRTTRIALQRLLYVATVIPMQDAYQKGTWDSIGGVTYENSYYAIGAAVFVASQFMGTSSKANNSSS